MELMVLLVAVAELDDHDQVGGGTATTSPLPPNLSPLFFAPRPR